MLYFIVNSLLFLGFNWDSLLLVWGSYEMVHDAGEVGCFISAE